MIGEKEREKIDLENPAFYNNRELSWLEFNKRVLEEAKDKQNPLLERMKFISIVSSNLDEFYMIRVAGLKDQVKVGYNDPENKTGMTPIEQLKKISARNHGIVLDQDTLYQDRLLPELKREKIEFLPVSSLKQEAMRFIKDRFENYIFPVLTPMAVDSSHPFPMLLNKTLNLAVVLRKETQTSLAIVQVPNVLPRFFLLPGRTASFILLEDIISHYISMLFSYEVISVSPFRITRNADLLIHEEDSHDLLREIEKELKKRRRGAAVRLELQKNTPAFVVSALINFLDIEQEDIYYYKSPLDLTFLMKAYDDLAGQYPKLVFKKMNARYPEELKEDKNIFNVIRRKDLFLHHPYDSFQPVIDFVSQAADDPRVLAIKQTLYRVSGDSPIIGALARAAENGKQVMVLVELKARFDEANNIQWARTLEKAGVHVIYGVPNLKTHSKITLVVRQEGDTIERFVHLGTGNYNDSTANFYTDMGLLTAKEGFGIDATSFFNHLSGYMEKPNWNYLSIAPFELRDRFIELINDEIAEHLRHHNGHIIAKMNSLTDKKIILKLYEASQAGVRIELIVRGICCLRPGIAGVSETVTVRSIVGQYLEHSRIFYFQNDRDPRIFLSSADWMTRNMDRRVEILFPIFDLGIKNRITNILETLLSDNVKAREQYSDGSYHYIQRKTGEKAICAQEVFQKQARQPNEKEKGAFKKIRHTFERRLFPFLLKKTESK